MKRSLWSVFAVSAGLALAACGRAGEDAGMDADTVMPAPPPEPMTTDTMMPMDTMMMMDTAAMTTGM